MYNSLRRSFFNLHIVNLWSTLAVCFVVSITGIKIMYKIAKILIKDSPVAKDRIATLEISKEYLHISNFFYFDFAIFNCILMSLNKSSNSFIYIFNLYKVIFETDQSKLYLYFFDF